MKILFLNENAMQNIMNMAEAISAVKEAASEYSKGNSNIPLRTNINIKEHNGDSLYMYGYVKGSNALGIKLVSVFPDNKNKGISSCPATMILENAETGEVKCIMDGTYLTRLRTGALSGAATSMLARDDASVYAQIGTGGQAECQLMAVLAVRNIKEVLIFASTYESAKSFCDKMSNKLTDSMLDYCKTKNVPKFVPCMPKSDYIKNADIITTVTVSNEAVFNPEFVKIGCHINAVGSYTPQMSEIDEKIVLKANKIVVDTLDGTINETGDFLKPMNKGLFKKEMITGELGELVDGKIKGRENNTELTLFETTGSAVFDLVTAEKIYEMAIKKGLGTTIDM